MPDYYAHDGAQQINVAGDNTGIVNVVPVYQVSPPRPVVTHTLRRDVRTFLGRNQELERIVAAAQPGQAVSLHTIDGMPGVGKTALAVRAAHALKDRFPDGQYFVQLHAHTPGQAPADPLQVLAGLLTGLGVDPRHLPDSLAERQDMWRDRIADKRVLLVLDDARDHVQIEPLLPGGGGCVTLVTSHRRLVALDDAQPLTLEVLAPSPAAELFATLAYRTPASDTDRAAVAQIVRLCGFLPLAIVLLAGRLAHHPTWSLTGSVAEFAAAADWLAELDAGDRAVQAAFTLSYQDLTARQQLVFRRLGLHPGLDTDTYATAALVGWPIDAVRRELEVLYTAHLVDETDSGRFRLHDLLRTYARALTAKDPDHENEQAHDRLLDYYQNIATAADRWLATRTNPTYSDAAAPMPGMSVQNLDDYMRALEWMRRERENLLACLEYTAAHRLPRMVTLTGLLTGLLERDGPWPQARKLYCRAAEAAELLGDRLGYANTLSNLGLVCRHTAEFSEAADLHERALTIYREIGNRLGEANALNNLGVVRQHTGDGSEAADLHQRGLAIHREIGNRRGEASALNNLGLARQEFGEFGEAADLHRQGLVIHREIGNRRGEASALYNLGLARRHIGDFSEAAGLIQQALAIDREIGNRRGEAHDLDNLGVVLRHVGEFGKAADLHRQGLAIHREIGSRRGEASSLGNLGVVLRHLGEFGEAGDLIQQALVMYRQIGNRRGEVEQLNEIGKLSLAIGAPHDALRTFTSALELANDIDSQHEQAHALEGAAHCHIALGDSDAALAHLRAALGIYRRIGVVETDSAAAYLAMLESS
ncbi:tetratricopeptide repeat protein [Nocardia panacis]|uniref:Tetratricopeptide repeat protein n=1 Tax=Nocardia panacis TaxID=2340916 RepID=A0A3A4KM36_9NOCA|nr:tetratricopeptide repeat protein [Nocardia panacis]RJO75096.1 tetratricopeptide repeat protein [Nocardia panacis]